MVFKIRRRKRERRYLAEGEKRKEREREKKKEKRIFRENHRKTLKSIVVLKKTKKLVSYSL